MSIYEEGQNPVHVEMTDEQAEGCAHRWRSQDDAKGWLDTYHPTDEVYPDA